VRETETQETSSGAAIRTFLIADVRGYTLFTQQRGDEAAAKLAAKFAQIVREEVPAREGELLELRGDEALTIFASPRQAIRAALDLQERFVEETVADPNIPLAVGIGMDAGEAVPVEGGYRGGALNLAARLCGRAGPGEILASQEVTHLARRMDGVRYVDRGSVQMKGLTDPVRVVKIEPETADPAVRLRQVLAPAPTPHRRWVPRTLRTRVIAAAVAVAVIAGAVVAGLSLTGEDAIIEANAIGLIDATSGSVVDSIPVTTGRGGLASGEGAVWAAGSRPGTLLRLDPSTHVVVDQIEVTGSPTGIATSPGAVWAAIGDEGVVERINPSTNTSVGTERVGNGPAGIAAGYGSVWVANRLDGTVSKLDPQTNTVADPIPAGSSPTGVATAAGSVWVTNADGATVTRIDPESGNATRISVGNGPEAVAGSDDAMWVLNGADGTVSRIDPATNSVVAVVPVGEGPVALAIAGGSVWVASEFSGTVSRIDPGSNRVTDVIDVQGTPLAVTSTGGLLWVTTGPAAGAHRGGTLTFVSSTAPDFMDPALAYSIEAWQILHHTNDGLVGYRKVGGQGGSILVPDLATSLPEPTDGGRTYTFTLRRDVRYSTGGVVRASDVRESIERALSARPQSSAGLFFEAIEGASSCTPGDTGCDLSRGIEANDEAGTVTFHLSRPDPDFLYKLSLTFASVLPADAPPARGEAEEPLPATGPYMIASYTPGEGEGPDRTEGRLEVVRNPRFREWSRAAQPDGNPDRFVWRIGLDPDEATDLVQEGAADWMAESPPVSRLEQVRTQYTDRVHEYPNPFVLGMSFNTRVHPFDDERVRRAVNYAVDRRTAAAFFTEARITCQILPPNFPGHRPYCPYQSEADPSAEWTAPDLEEADRLIDEAGVDGTEVTVWTLVDKPPFDFPGLGRYMVSLLNNLGFRARVRLIEDGERYFDLVSNSRTQAQLFAVGWAPDFTAPSNFLDLLFSCESFVPNSRFNLNYAELCDPKVDALIERAFDLQLTDPSVAGGAWADVDRAVVDTAAWVPVANPISIDFLSERVGNYQRHPHWGVLLGQLWVR
jgi:YVTN family beta-propeller protein